MKKLGFGLMRLPLLDPNDETSVDLEQVKHMVDLFLERGFTYFDTAIMYHNCASQRIAKEVLVDRYPRSCTARISIPSKTATASFPNSWNRPAPATLTITSSTASRLRI